MNILGINAFHGDSSAAMLREGTLVSAIEEERFNRVKHWAGLPVEAAKWVSGGVAEYVAISRDPWANLSGKLRHAVSRPADWPKMLSRAKNSARVTQFGSDLRAAGLSGFDQEHVYFVEHHRAHLASAFFASPFEEAAVVSVDGFGDFRSVMWGSGQGNKIQIKGAVRFPHSLDS